MIGARREKVFGPGRYVPLDRNAKCRIAAYARAWSARNRQPGSTQGADHPRLPGRAAGPAVGLPQRPHRLLLSVLPAHRREGGLCQEHGCRGAEALEWADVLTPISSMMSCEERQRMRARKLHSGGVPWLGAITRSFDCRCCCRGLGPGPLSRVALDFMDAPGEDFIRKRWSATHCERLRRDRRP